MDGWLLIQHPGQIKEERMTREEVLKEVEAMVKALTEKCADKGCDAHACTCKYDTGSSPSLTWDINCPKHGVKKDVRK
jgi:hypothetical protein